LQETFGPQQELCLLRIERHYFQFSFVQVVTVTSVNTKVVVSSFTVAFIVGMKSFTPHLSHLRITASTAIAELKTP
jgi:hypothetical protein